MFDTDSFSGAAIFGLLADRYGRKWPMVINMWIVCAARNVLF